jgi:hypothetical protein
MKTLESLDAALSELRRGLQSVSPPPALEGALVARFRREHLKSTRPGMWWMPPLALAATIALVTWIVRAPMPPMQTPIVTPAAIEADAGPFLALKPLERIALEPGTTVVATEFPRALLADWGLPVSPDRAGETVRARML